MKTKPQMWLDSSLPKTYSAPINPETGEVWTERLNELVDLATFIRYSSPDEEASRTERRKEYQALREGVEFRDAPHFIRHAFTLGANAFLPGHDGSQLPEIYGCHPETWALASSETKARYDVVNLDKNRLKQ